MRKLILVLIIAGSVIYSQKMIHKNSYSLGGGMLISFSEKDHPEYNSITKSFRFDPSFTYHLFDVFTLGSNILFEYAEEKIDEESGSTRSVTRLIGIGPKSRYYFHDENYAPFIELSINYSHVLPAKTEGYSYSIGGGLNYFFTKSAALEPKISFTASSLSTTHSPLVLEWDLIII